MMLKIPAIKKSFQQLFLNHKDLLMLSLILLIALISRLYLIDKIPPNITGDESWDISNIYRIAFGKDTNIFTLLGDGSVSAVVFYPVAFMMKFFGIENSLFYLRLNIITYSLFSLIPFYYILREKTSTMIAYFFTLLLSANYVFLNFSRTAWVNVMCVFSGLFMIYFIEKALKEKIIKWYILSGIFAGISFYGYHYGRILVIGLFLFLLIRAIYKKSNKEHIGGLIIFSITTLLVSAVYFISFISNGQEPVFRRPAATFAFSSNKLAPPNNFSEVFYHQLEYTIKGFILLDGSVMNEGIENSRYVPFENPPVNLLIKIVFIGGLIYFLIKERKSIWWIVFASIVLTQVISDLPPNYSRGIFYIPFIYFVTGVFSYKLISEFIRYFKNKKIIYLFASLVFIFILIYDTNLYFNWMKTPEEYSARQPAIDYREFQLWQDYQISLVKKGELPITNYAWYDIKDSLIKH